MTDHDFIDKKALSERSICTKFITPAIKAIQERIVKRVEQWLGWCDAL